MTNWRAQDDTPTMTARFLHRSRAPELFVRVVEPAVVQCRLLFVHASMIHSEYYLPLALRLARYGVETWLPDLRGHGRSEGIRGHTQDWRDPLDDVAATWEAMLGAGPVPLTVAGGESYGAYLVYWAIRERRATPDRGIFLSPAFGLHFHPSPLFWWLLRQAWPVAARLRPVRALSVDGVTRDTLVEHMIDRDPLCNRHYTLGFLLHLMASQRQVPRPDPDWRLPTLVMLSADDPITDNHVSRAVFAGNPAVQYLVGEGGLHSLVADHPDWVLESMAEWMMPEPRGLHNAR